ncbi:MAG: hypothetical protein KAJ10_05385 [Thermodesulfovibrionia bacterium]|nr:hypothetical protein [Thermodesulfovibrionia bacterium]
MPNKQLPEVRRQAAKEKLYHKIERWAKPGFSGIITIAMENGIVAPDITVKIKEKLEN